MAVAWENNDAKPTMDVTPGVPCAPFIDATALETLPDQAPLPWLASREDFRGTITEDEDMNVQALYEDAQRSRVSRKAC